MADMDPKYLDHFDTGNQFPASFPTDKTDIGIHPIDSISMILPVNRQSHWLSPLPVCPQTARIYGRLQRDVYRLRTHYSKSEAFHPP